MRNSSDGVRRLLSLGRPRDLVHVEVERQNDLPSPVGVPFLPLVTAEFGQSVRALTLEDGTEATGGQRGSPHVPGTTGVIEYARYQPTSP